MANIVTSNATVGVFILNSLLPPGMSVRGLQANGVFIEASQANDNARRVLATSGASILLTNSVRSGTITLRVARVSKDIFNFPFSNPQNTQSGLSVQSALNATVPGMMNSGDLVLYAGLIQQTGQGTGSTITVYYDINNATEIVIFLGCGLKKVDPLKLSGADVPIYDISFDYSDFIRT